MGLSQASYLYSTAHCRSCQGGGLQTQKRLCERYAEPFSECAQAAFEVSAELFALIASAHTFIAGLTAMAVIARLHLNAGQCAAVLIIAMIMAACYTATNAGVCVFAVHNISPQKAYYRFRRNTFCPGAAEIMHHCRFKRYSIAQASCASFSGFPDASNTKSSAFSTIISGVTPIWWMLLPRGVK